MGPEEGQFVMMVDYGGLSVEAQVRYRGLAPGGEEGSVELVSVLTPAGADILDELDDAERDRLTALAWKHLEKRDET